MNICPLTYQPCDGLYSPAGLKRLAPRLTQLKRLPYSSQEQLHEAAARAPRMSIQGVQPKLSARLSVSRQVFEIVTTGGRYLLKPPNPQFPALPENEDLSMRMAAATGIETPLHGLLYAKDGSLTYFIKRFDRTGRKGRLAVEDFAQLAGRTRDTKYDGSMEKVASVIEQFCTFPAIEKSKLFHRTLVNFLIGNEDMHLKNFSLITRNYKVELSPAYDFVNTTIVLAQAREETALPIKGKKRKLDRSLLVDYFGRERLNLAPKVIEVILAKIETAFPQWEKLINVSFLGSQYKAYYFELCRKRRAVLY